LTIGRPLVGWQYAIFEREEEADSSPLGLTDGRAVEEDDEEDDDDDVPKVLSSLLSVSTLVLTLANIAFSLSDVLKDHNFLVVWPET
jgi:hypothetical protein